MKLQGSMDILITIHRKWSYNHPPVDWDGGHHLSKAHPSPLPLLGWTDLFKLVVII